MVFQIEYAHQLALLRNRKTEDGLGTALLDIRVVGKRILSRCIIQNHFPPRSEHILQYGFGNRRSRNWLLMQFHLDLVTTCDGLRLNPGYAVPQQDKKATFSARILYREHHQG